MTNPKYPILDDLEIPDALLSSWQDTVDLLAELFSTPAALIMRVHAQEIEVLVASRSEGNVYRPGATHPLDTGLYCEHVMDTKRELVVPDAMADPAWRGNPDIGLGMISYLGLPLTWPFGEQFGTICVLDNKEISYSARLHGILKRFQQSVLYGLESVYQANYHMIKAQEANERFGVLLKALQQCPVGLAIADERLRVVHANPRYESMAGRLASGSFDAADHCPGFGAAMEEEIRTTLARRDDWEGELTRVVDGEHDRFEQIRVSKLRDSAGCVANYLIIREDVTEARGREAKLRQLAMFDPTTGLPNRALVIDRLNNLIKVAQRKANKVAVLFIDLDDFKMINDTMGHESGDELIVDVAGRLKEIIRSSDTLGRFGGDEFVVLMGDIEDAEPVERLVQDIRSVLSVRCKVKNRSVSVSASIGIAVFPEDGDSASLLFRNSDLAMYQSKAVGRGSATFYTPMLNAVSERRLRVEEQLHQAMECDEFEVAYQAQVEIRSGRTIGYEALLRWRNGELGEVSPSDFIPIAERSHLIVTIGGFVLDRALAQLSAWRRNHGQHLKMAVNVSPRQFCDESLLTTIRASLERHGLPSESLEVEITEGLLLSTKSHVFEKMSALRELGVTIAMDDFGTGYSSLSYLSHYPFNVIKIDQEFIRNIEVDSCNRHLVKSIILMAHGLGHKVIAEGVETKEQLALLTEFGCDFAQGYLFGKPMPAERIPALSPGLRMPP